MWTKEWKFGGIHQIWHIKLKNAYIQKKWITQISVEFVPWNRNGEIIMDLEHRRDEGVTWNDNCRLKQPRIDIDKPNAPKFNKKNKECKFKKEFIPLNCTKIASGDNCQSRTQRLHAKKKSALQIRRYIWTRKTQQ